MSYIIQGMRDLLAKGENLPTLPTVVFQLHRVLDNENAGAGEVADVIERDPAITARLLRAANSAAFSRGGDRVGSVSLAVARLGVRQVRAVCIALAVVKAFGARKGALDHHAFWIHSATVGMIAREVWDALPTEPAGGVSADDIYVSGLLHDAGLLVLEQFFPDEFNAILETQALKGARLWQLEEEDLGMDHGAVGGLLMGRWSLPPFIGEAVTNHHHPHQANEEFQVACRVVQAAEVLCSQGETALPQEGPADCSPSDVLTELGVTDEDQETLLSRVPVLAEKAGQFLA